MKQHAGTRGLIIVAPYKLYFVPSRSEADLDCPYNRFRNHIDRETYLRIDMNGLTYAIPTCGRMTYGGDPSIVDAWAYLENPVVSPCDDEHADYQASQFDALTVVDDDGTVLMRFTAEVVKQYFENRRIAINANNMLTDAEKQELIENTNRRERGEFV